MGRQRGERERSGNDGRGERERFWRGVLERRAVSGMSIVDFCDREGLKASTYHYWQREIRRRDGVNSKPRDERGARRLDELELQRRNDDLESSHSQTEAAPLLPPLLTPVRIVDERVGPSDAAVEILATNGLRVRVGEQATSEQLRRVLQAISELS